MSRQTILSILVILLPVAAFGQSNCAAYMPHPDDKIEKYCIDITDAGPPQDGAVWSLSGKQIGNRKIQQSFRSVGDTVPCMVSTERQCLTYLCDADGCVYEKGCEDNTQRTVYGTMPLYMPHALHYGYTKSGIMHGIGSYCDRLQTASHGTWTVACDARGTIVTPEGDSIRNVLRVHSTRHVTTAFHAKADSLGHTAIRDTAKAIATSDAIIESYRWYVDGYRYPMLELCVLRSGDSGASVGSAYYTPIETLEQYRGSNDTSTFAQADGNDSHNVATDGPDFKYQISNNTESRKITVHHSSQSPYDVTAILADIRGIVYQTVSHKGCTEGSLSLNYGGLPHGQYVVYIRNGINVFAEKFNNQ